MPALAQEAPDPFDEPAPTTAPAETGEADPKSAAESTTESTSESTAEAVSDLESEYGFDPADEFSSVEEPEDRDPWEGFNRAVFRFNDTADRWVLKPIAISYRQITPIFMQTGITNFFANLGEVTNTTNDVLQWKWGQAGNDAGRFVVNSTIGVGGLFDVARRMGLKPNDGEDFSQTLAVWGVPSGPYLVIPFMGPSTVRDVPGEIVDLYTNPLTYIDDDATRLGLKFADIIQTRASYLQVETLVQGDRYILLRDAYLQRRDFLIKDGELNDDFGEELQDETESAESDTDANGDTDSETDAFDF